MIKKLNNVQTVIDLLNGSNKYEDQFAAVQAFKKDLK